MSSRPRVHLTIRETSRWLRIRAATCSISSLPERELDMQADRIYKATEKGRARIDLGGTKRERGRR